ncbi:MAG: 4-phosphoerythronate dehydrogenase [Bacteroidia bacterium]|nr:4-phosphoerythronate dehydrogenase [Bacteroidia bacterium]
MKFIVDDKIPYIKGVLEPFAEVSYLAGASISSADVHDADALVIRTRTKCNEALLDGSSVKAIFTATIGFDHIDTSYCEERGILWKSAPGCNSSSVQQYIASVLAALHQDKKIDIQNTTIAIVGVGNVGSKVANWCEKLGMNVLLVDPFKKVNAPSNYVDLEVALPQADIVTFHTPLTRAGEYATYHLLDSDTIKLLKRGAIIINTSRGEVCATDALLQGLDSGIISDVVVDVWESEPIVNRDLLDKAYIATPHVAGYSYDSKRNGTEMSVRNLDDFFSLGIKESVSGVLPEPNDALLLISDDMGRIDAACKMFLHTYDVRKESAYFKMHSDEFEHYRGNYPLRREIWAYSIYSDYKFAEYLESFGIRCLR